MSGQDRVIKIKRNALKNLIFTNWHMTRWIRLAIGLALMYQAIAASSPLPGLFSVFFLVQAIGNIGCCFSSACSVPLKKNNTSEVVTYEEIK